MKILIIIIMSINLFAVNKTQKKIYTINKIPKCPKTRKIMSEITIERNNNKTYTKKVTFMKICKTKKEKIKLIIKKTINDSYIINH